MSDSGIVLDFGRGGRIGLDEAVLCAGKSDAHLAAILDRVAARGASMLLTRLSPEALAALPAAHRARLDYDALSATGFYGEVAPATREGRVAIVAAGTSDMRVCREAERTLAFSGERATGIHDVGVAGMDAAMVSVLGGLVPGIVIGVPTSTGYGAARGGETALHAALASCAPGVAVVNIDNGYGAACAALRALRVIDRRTIP